MNGTSEEPGVADLSTDMQNRFDVNKCIASYLQGVGSITDLDKNLVVNLSDHVLTDDERSLLSKGLTFCPTPGEADMVDLKRDLDRFH